MYKDKDKNKLYTLLDTNPEIKYRIKIILLANDGYTVPELREMTNTYDKTIRKWIHKFNDNGIEGLFTKIDYSPMVKIGLDPYFWEHFSHYFMDIIFHYQYLSPSPPFPLAAFSI